MLRRFLAASGLRQGLYNDGPCTKPTKKACCEMLSSRNGIPK